MEQPTQAAALDALTGSATGFDLLSVPPEAVPGVHPVIAGSATYQYQESLPPLPVPPLAQTLHKYITCLQPLLAHDPPALKRAIAAVHRFEQHEGPSLHQALLDLAASTGKEQEWPNSHWLEKIWDTLAYLSDRVPLPLSVNCMGTLFECSGTNYPTWRGGAVIHGLLRFDQALREGTLNAESLDGKGKIPLCMYQYERLYRHSRIPVSVEADRWISYPQARHVAVVVNSRWYTFDALRNDGSILSTSECVRELDSIRRLAQADDAKHVSQFNFASMTCGPRHVWHAHRKKIQDSTSTAATTLERIESAIFHVCLSSSTPETPEELMNLGCHGHGTDVWMDKSFSMLVTANGKMVFNMEHSHADAPMHSRMIEYMKHTITKEATIELAQDRVANVVYTSTVMPLRWGLEGLTSMQKLETLHHNTTRTEVEESSKPKTKVKKKKKRTGPKTAPKSEMTTLLSQAHQFTTSLIASHRLALLNFTIFGKVLLKQLKTSPDSFIQMALQLSFYRNQQRFTATYETGTTRAFYHGRTETIRSLTNESRALCVAMGGRIEQGKAQVTGSTGSTTGSTGSTGSTVSMATKYQLLRQALASHGQYLKDSCQGQAIDRHMLGLRIMAMQRHSVKGTDMPSIFTDPSYALMNTFELSTSSMAVTNYRDYLGFGAPSPNAYGCCYCMTANALLMVISANAACSSKDVNVFHDDITQALLDLIQVLQTGTGSKV